MKNENQKLRQEIAGLRQGIANPAATADPDDLVAPATEITEAALKKGWKVTKGKSGTATSIDGHHSVYETMYTLINQATVLVVDGKVDRMFLEPRVGMKESELLDFNRVHYYDGEKPNSSIEYESASEIEYKVDGWRATIDKSTHKVVSISH